MKIQTFFEKAGNGACLALSYLKAALPDATPQMLFDALWTAAENGIVDAEDDMFVKDAVKLMSFANPSKKFTVVKQKISTLQGLKLAAVKYELNGYGHWVLVEKGEIIFNSLDFSNCVEYGKPVDARVIEIGDL